MNMRRTAFPLIAGAIATVAFAAGVVIAGDAYKRWTNPDEGRSPEEVLAAQDANSKAFWARYTTWLENENELGVDPSTYPTTEAMVSTDDPAPTLGEAAKQADLIIMGDVVSLQFRATADSVAKISITDIAKGGAGQTVDVLLPNALMPADELTWTPVLSVVPAMPVLYPGDQVVLFLASDPASDGGMLSPLPWSGTYKINEGTVVPIEGNRFAAAVDDWTLAELMDAVRGAQAE